MKDDTFTTALFACLDETFDTHHGIYLDKGTSLSETLAPITAAEASRAAAAQSATMAAQVAHITFYLEVLERYILTGDAGKADWRAIWTTVREVTPDEWKNAKDTFRDQLLTDRRNRFFASYMVKAKQKMKIEVNRDTLQKAIGT